jgi:hypothetical protein
MPFLLRGCNFALQIFPKRKEAVSKGISSFFVPNIILFEGIYVRETFKVSLTWCPKP